MADDPWQFLSLDPSTATVRDVKAAYARLLKIHRPDQDPEGFKRLRSAYEAVLLMLETPAAIDRPSQPPAPLPVSEAVKPADGDERGDGGKTTLLAEAVRALQDVVATRIRQKIREAWTRFDETADNLDLDLHARCDGLLAAFSQHLPLLAELSSDDRLINHLLHGEHRLPTLSLEQWGRDGDARRLSEFSVSLGRARQVEATEFGAIALVQTALGLAVWSPDAASKLAQRAYPHLPIDSRTSLMEAVDGQLILGRVLSPLAKDFKSFWLGQIRQTAPLCTWKDTMSRQMLAATIRQLGLQWPGFSVLRQTLPPENWSALEHAAIGMLR